MAILIDGKAVSAAERALIKEQVAGMKVTPGLAVILVGEDPASQVYVRNKKKACADVGIYSESYDLPAETSQAELLDLIDILNKKDDIHGILVQLPLPKHIDENCVINAILPEKDVDAFHPVNVGKIMTGDYDFLPCTPAGVMCLLKHYNIDPSGKECVVVGRSNIVGKPMSILLLRENGTVTITHSRTKDLKEVCKRADILIAALGKPKFITEEYVKEGAVVIDVGIHRNENNKLCGDVDFDAVAPKCSAITPVPGGVGPMTIAMLMKNCVDSVEINA